MALGHGARGIRALATVVALVVALAGCQPPQAAIDMTDPGVSAGSAKSCKDLGLSDVRCTLLTLRATKALDTERPNHARVTKQETHEAGTPPAGASPVPPSTIVAAIFVFTLADGSRVGVPMFCPRDGSTSDRACDPRIQ